jgi:hypothetical protein
MDHIHAVSFLYRTLGILWGVAALFVGVLFALMGTILAAIKEGCGERCEMPPVPLMVFIATFALVVMAALGVASFAAGWGAKARKPWARPLLIVLGILNLILNIPFGTAIGIYTLWVCISKKTAPGLEPDAPEGVMPA